MDPVLPDPGELRPVRVDHGPEARPLVQIVLAHVLGAVGPAVLALAVELARAEHPLVAVPVLVVILPVPSLQTINECSSVLVSVSPGEGSISIFQVILEWNFRLKCSLNESYLVRSFVLIAIWISVCSCSVLLVLPEFTLN